MAERHCTSCGAKVTWAVHVDTRRRSPIDADENEAGNVVFTHDPDLGGDPEYRVLTQAECAEELSVARYTNHFMTCPNAKQHKKGGR
jgi:hypothetical protein